MRASRPVAAAVCAAALAMAAGACGGQDQSTLANKKYLNNGTAGHDAGGLGIGPGRAADGVNDDQGGSQPGTYQTTR
jgi:hypothetical protein